MAIEWSWKLNTRLILLCVDCVWYAAILMITSGYTVWVNAYASTTGIAGILCPSIEISSYAYIDPVKEWTRHSTEIGVLLTNLYTGRGIPS